MYVEEKNRRKIVAMEKYKGKKAIDYKRMQTMWKNIFCNEICER